MGIFNFLWNKNKKVDNQSETDSNQTYKNRLIRLQSKTDVLPGKVENYWFENENIGLKRTLFHKIIIPLKPFNSGIQYEEQPVETCLLIDWLNLNLDDPKNLVGIKIISDENSKIDASVYVGDAHNPFDIIELVFEKIENNVYKICGEIWIDFEHEMVAINEGFKFETIVNVE